MRKMAFVAFDIDNSIFDRYDLDIVTDISGVGYKLKLSTIDGDIESIVTKVVQDKQDIKFKIHFINRAYEKSAILEQWIEKYSTADKWLALEYNDGIKRRYADGKLISLSKDEKDEYGQLVREAVFKPLTPFFDNVENVIRLRPSAFGKSHPFKYPYCYGRSMVENNEINNTYLLDVPVTVKIKGSIYEPTILLINEESNEYSRVKFNGLTLTASEYIIINSAYRKIWYYNGSTLSDYSAMTDPSYDTFLRAKSGKSTISINFTPTDSGELTGNWRKHGL